MTPLRFFATARDAVGVVGLILHYRPAGSADSVPYERVLLYDDGMSGDGGRLDGVFSGVMEETLAPGSEIEFYLEAENLSGERRYLPGSPSLEENEDQLQSHFNLMLPSHTDGFGNAIEISEVLPSNATGLPNK